MGSIAGWVLTEADSVGEGVHEGGEDDGYTD
jgi:hypothetical protein